MVEFSKALKKELRELRELGYERCLNIELKELDAQFDAWKAGTLDPFELSEKIHVFHNGASRELYNQFTGRHFQDIIVARLVLDGILSESELSAELLKALAGEIKRIKEYRAEDAATNESSSESS